MPAKVLSLDSYLRDDRVVNSSYSSGRTLLQHEVVVWDPEGIASRYAKGESYKNAPTLTDHSSVAFLGDLSRRTGEINDFLALGRLLVIFVPPPFRLFYATGQQRNDGTAAKPRMTRIVTEIAVQDVLPVPVSLVRGQGESIRLLAGPPFSRFWKAVADQFYFSAYFAAPVGQTLLAMGGTDRPVGALVEVNGGNVLFLPQLGRFAPDLDLDEDDPNYDEKYDEAQDELDARYHGTFVDALLTLHGELTQSGDEALPPWTEDYVLPDELEAVKSAIAAQETLVEAQQAVESAQAELVKVRRRKVMVAGTGRALEAQVHEALTDLGCSVEEGEPGRTDRVVRWGNKVGVLEVKGLTKSAKESDAAQLEKWVSLYIEDHGTAPKAILAVSAWRDVPLDERTQPAFPNQMLKYATAREHCLVETSQILAAAVTCGTKKAKDAFLKTLFETVGVVEGHGWETAFTKVESGEGVNT
jgi:hypothetical protein